MLICMSAEPLNHTLLNNKRVTRYNCSSILILNIHKNRLEYNCPEENMLNMQAQFKS